MSLHAWEWEKEDRASVGPISSMTSAHRSTSDYEMEEYLAASAQAQEWDSDDQYTSSLKSSEELCSSFDADEPQVVPCKFIISLAFPWSTGTKGKHASFMDKYKKSPKPDIRLVKARRYYHIEYFFLPDDTEPQMADVVLFPAIAKVFLDSEIKTVRPWREGDKVWVSWSQTFNVNMTKELLKKINFHKITMRLWDTKDKVSKKARYHRLKNSAFYEETSLLEEVKALVLNQKRLSVSIETTEAIPEEWPPGTMSFYQDKTEKFPKSPQEQGVPGHLLTSSDPHYTEPETPSKTSEEYEKSPKSEDLSSSRPSPVKTPPMSLAGITMQEIKELIEKASLSSLLTLIEKQKAQVKGRDSEVKKKHSKIAKKSLVEEEADPKLAASFWKPCVFSIQLAVMPLLAGWQTVITRGSEKSANILDCFLTLKTEVPIMTEEQKRDLNPLTIRIKCASCLPTEPVPIPELERLCTPVYCKYQFHKTPVHETKGQPHGTQVYFQDINVIFLGAIHPSDLREYLEGPPMVVEVHDRDRKSEDCTRKPVLFGEDPLDSYVNFQALISPKKTESNPFESQKKLWDPYGVARVSFAELLLGHKYLNLVVPIQNCEPQPTDQSQDGRNRKGVGSRVPTDVLQHSPMPMGNYMEADSLLKLRVDIAVPLSASVPVPELDFEGTQFGRIIFVFESKNPLVLHGLMRDITAINAKALELQSYPTQNIQQILSAFRIPVKIQDQQHLDVLTGFHLLDGKLHLLILEGLADHGLRQLWECHQRRVSASRRVVACKVLYNSRLLFHHRVYADLGTILYHVHLFMPMSQLLRQPMLYVRRAVPRLVFQALTRVHDICHSSTKLKDVIVRGLLPSSPMVKGLNQEFGVPISQEDLMEGHLLFTLPQPTINVEKFRSQTSTLTMEIQAHQERYLQWRGTMLLEGQIRKESVIQKNIMEAYHVTKKPLRPKGKVIRISLPANKAVHNYSIQTLNSSELAKRKLQEQMAREPRKRFTYSQNYQSATLEPQDTQEEERKAQKSHRAWLTATGFQVWGLQASAERVLCPKPTEEWKEKALFANRLKPVLDRDRWGWAQRHQDFELYRKPPPFLELPPPPAPKLAKGRKPKALPPCPKQQGHGHPLAKPLNLWDSAFEILEDSLLLKDHQLVPETLETPANPACASRKSLTGPQQSTPTLLS